jgi:hypothetical protein
MITKPRVLYTAAALAVAAWAALPVGLGLMVTSDVAHADQCLGHDHATKTAEKAAQESKGAEKHEHNKATLHGGRVTAAKEHHFETVFAADGLRVFLYNANQSPMMIKKVQGTATLVFENGAEVEIPLVRGEPKEGDPAVHFCPMHEEVVQRKTGLCTHCSGMKLFVQDYLYAKADLSKVKPDEIKASITIEGLKGKEKRVTFTQIPVEEQKEETETKEG